MNNYITELISQKIGGRSCMPRIVAISRWKPEQTPAVLQRFADFLKGKDPTVMDAFKRLNFISWDFPSAYGQTTSVYVAEGDMRDFSIFNRYWMDLLEYEVLPCVDFEAIIKFYPDKVINALNP